GCLLVADALVHRGHRDLAYAGSALLLLATWVRLGDLGVTAPEPYTLPLAVALTAVGLLHLRRFPAAGTATALLPGLLLGTVPSLLWVL
ncbi:SCO7613 C-terminal domain-containing membrane protein, partial [Salmonella enterica]|uniref:SCO7613 C-terminal domain-containing membrane protein n=1 Tax=Salmonella enterica TaxID=28901 RepID=UPI003299E64B